MPIASKIFLFCKNLKAHPNLSYKLLLVPECRLVTTNFRSRTGLQDRIQHTVDLHLQTNGTLQGYSKVRTSSLINEAQHQLETQSHRCRLEEPVQTLLKLDFHLRLKQISILGLDLSCLLFTLTNMKSSHQLLQELAQLGFRKELLSNLQGSKQLQALLR